MNPQIIHYENPYLMSSLAKLVHYRMLNDKELQNIDVNQWYKCDLSILNQSLKSKFIQLNYDQETDHFIQTCYQKSNWIFTHVFNFFAKAILSWFMTATSINGLLKRGSMFVFSSHQFHQIFDNISIIKSDQDSNLLDLGAGDGKVTKIMAQYFNSTHCTEISSVMARLLNESGFNILDYENWAENDSKYDLISCLNILDRCDRPLTMLQKVRTKLKPNGRVLVALVLPLKQYVESSTNYHEPIEKIFLSGHTKEEQLESLEEIVFKPIGLEIIHWTVLPYLCEGDINQAFYWLKDIVILLKLSKNTKPQSI